MRCKIQWYFFTGGVNSLFILDKINYNVKFDIKLIIIQTSALYYILLLILFYILCYILLLISWFFLHPLLHPFITSFITSFYWNVVSLYERLNGHDHFPTSLFSQNEERRKKREKDLKLYHYTYSKIIWLFSIYTPVKLFIRSIQNYGLVLCKS